MERVNFWGILVMSTPDFTRSRLDAMIDMRHPLAVLAQRLPWGRIEQALASKFTHQERPAQRELVEDLLGQHAVEFGAGLSNAGRPRLSIRLMASLLYLKNSFDLSDEELVQRWSENVVWQFFSGQQYYEPRLPCDATQIGRFRKAIGEAGMEELLKASIETAVQIKAIKPLELETLRRKAGGYAHAKQFRRLKKVVKRQRTILGVVLREVKRKLDLSVNAPLNGAGSGGIPSNPKAISDLWMWLERAERIRTQQRHDKNKLYALHAPEVECIGKGKARKPYEFGVKVSLAVTHKQGLMVGARSFTGNPFDGHILAAQLEQTTILLQDLQRSPKQVIVDLGFRGVDADNPGVQIIHRGKYKSLTSQERRWLKRRQAIEPMIGHAKSDNRMDRCWLQGALGDALHALSCAPGYNIRWLMRAIVRLGLRVVFLRLLLAALMAPMARPSSAKSSYASRLAAWARSGAARLTWSAPTSAFAAA